jgi:hypothetical protein
MGQAAGLLKVPVVFTLRVELVHPPPRKVSLAQGTSTGVAPTPLDAMENASPNAAKGTGFMEVSDGDGKWSSL